MTFKHIIIGIMIIIGVFCFMMGYIIQDLLRPCDEVKEKIVALPSPPHHESNVVAYRGMNATYEIVERYKANFDSPYYVYEIDLPSSKTIHYDSLRKIMHSAPMIKRAVVDTLDKYGIQYQYKKYIPKHRRVDIDDK